MKPATSAAPGSTSPTSPASVRFMPTSTTTPPGLTMSAVDERRAARPRRRARRRRACGARGRACASGRSSRSRSPAASRWRRGLPTMSLRPTTTARAPSSSISCSSSSAITPRGVAGTSAGRPRYSSPGVHRDGSRRRPSPGRRARITCASSMWSGSGSWTRIASTSSSRVQLGELARAARPRAIVRRQAQVGGVEARLDRRLVLEPDVDLGRRIVADEHRREADVAERAHLLGDLGADARRRAACPSSVSRPCAGV